MYNVTKGRVTLSFITNMSSKFFQLIGLMKRGGWLIQLLHVALASLTTDSQRSDIISELPLLTLP
jgi:hypothetical protein